MSVTYNQIDSIRKRLLENNPAKHKPDDVGFWLISGEGKETTHYATGRYADVVELALMLDFFIGYGGAGGSVRKIDAVEVTPEYIAKRKKLLEEKETLKTRLREIEEKL